MANAAIGALRRLLTQYFRCTVLPIGKRKTLSFSKEGDMSKSIHTEGITRRNFLTGAAVAGAGATLMGLVGC